MATAPTLQPVDLDLADLKYRVECLEQMVGTGRTTLTPHSELSQKLRDQVEQITRQIFSEVVSVLEVQDPELYGRWQWVYHIREADSSKRLIAKHLEWYQQMRSTVGDYLDYFCLSIEVKE